jgi:hypothetical protein
MAGNADCNSIENHQSAALPDALVREKFEGSDAFADEGVQRVSGRRRVPMMAQQIWGCGAGDAPRPCSIAGGPMRGVVAGVRQRRGLAGE